METGASGKGRTIGDLLLRLRKDRDFPSISEHVQSICRLADTEKDVSVSDLANEILKDIAVTNKLLKLVNSAYYAQFGEEISTVSRAVAVLGFEQVRNAALGLMLFEHLKKHARLPELVEATNEALFAGLIGGRVAERVAPGQVEEARISSMFHRLGRLLVMFYFPEVFEEIRARADAEGIPEERAAREVLGGGYEELALEVGRFWNLPRSLLQTLRDPPPGAAAKPREQGEALRLVAALSADLSRAVNSGAPNEESTAEILGRYGEALAIDAETLGLVVREALERAAEGDSMIRIGRTGRSLLARARRWTGAGGGNGDGEESPAGAEGGRDGPPEGGDARDIILRGMQEVTRTLLCSREIDDVIRIILETGFRAAGLSHFLFCVRDTRRPVLVARFGFGREVERFKRDFAAPVGAAAGSVFSEAIDEGRDVFVDDTDSPRWRNRVPPWHRALVPARSILLLPVRAGEVTLGLFYGDVLKSLQGAGFRAELLPALKTLRDQALLAVTRRG